MQIIKLFLKLFLFFVAMSILPASAAQNYTCPMHPHYIVDEPGNCPICGMFLVPVKDNSSEEKVLEEESSESMQNRNMKNEHPSDKTEKKTIMIPPETIQNIGVRLEKATTARFGTGIRSYGLVTENVRSTQTISVRAPGWVEDLSITAIGDEVNAGDLLFTLYSPDLISAQQDYIAALVAGVKNRIDSSARRLRSLGVTEQAIIQIRKKRKNLKHIPFYAKKRGIVSDLMVTQGSYVKTGSKIAIIQDYSTVWIDVSVAEKDLQFLTENSKATVHFRNLGNLERDARVDYIYPTINPDDHTGRVRLVLNNSGGTLRPGAYADVRFSTHVDWRLSVPSEAVLKSSEGDFVVVALGDGRFQSKKVQIGIINHKRTEITSGIAEGDDIVASGQFLIDSESSLQESFRKLQKIKKPLSLIDVSTEQLVIIDHVIDAALYLHDAHTASFDVNTELLTPAIKASTFLLSEFVGTQLERYVLNDMQKALVFAVEATTKEKQKQAMALLVAALKPWILEGKPQYYKQKGVRLYLDHGTENHWLQLGDAIKNPYSKTGHAVEIILPNTATLSEHELSPSSSAPNEFAPNGGAHAHH